MPQADLLTTLATDHPSEELRQRLRTLAQQSTYFMGKVVVGFHDLDPDLHGMMAKWIQRPTKRKLGLAPRGHLKTSLWTVSDSLRRIAADPNVRILIVNEIEQNAIHMLSRIKVVSERRELFRWLFPEIIPMPGTTRWSATEAEFKRDEDYPECTVEAIGVGGASTSRHYNVIKEDDLCGKEAQKSVLVMQRAIEQHMLAEPLLNSPRDEIQTYGTRWGPNDVADWMLKHETNLDYLCLSILRPNGEPIWPERFTQEHIENLKAKSASTPGWYALQYENRVVASGATEFDPKWLRYWHWSAKMDGTEVIVLERPLDEGGNLEYTLEQLTRWELIDAGLSPESSAARTAIVVAGLTPNNPYDIIVLQADARRTTPRVTIDNAWAAWQRWRPILAGIEVVSAHITFFYWIPTVYPDLGIRKLRTDTHTSKDQRIRTLGPFAEQGRLYIHRTQADFVDEWAAFPSKGATRDLLDALAYGPQIWAPPEDENEDLWDEDDEVEEELPRGRSPLTGY